MTFWPEMLHLQALLEAAWTQSKAVKVAGATELPKRVFKRSELLTNTRWEGSGRRSPQRDKVWALVISGERERTRIWSGGRVYGTPAFSMRTHTRAEGVFLLGLQEGCRGKGVKDSRQPVVKMECLSLCEIRLWGFWGLAVWKSPNVQAMYLCFIHTHTEPKDWQCGQMGEKELYVKL